MNKPPYLSYAESMIGLSETKGSAHNPLILRMWARIRAPFTDDETPWCAGFVGDCLEATGIKSSRSAAARSYLRWGVPLGKPQYGCIVVFERGPKFGHVGFAVGKDRPGNIMVLGGNQGDKVCIRPFSPSRVIGFRAPPGVILDDFLPPIDSDGKLSSDEA